MRIPTLFAAVTLVAVAACHYRPTPVPLAGDGDSIRMLAGEWNGTYTGTDSRRTGSITFSIRVNGDSAFGEVVMGTGPGGPIIVPADNPVAHRVHARGPQMLAVRFVGVIGGEVSGALEPYVAPDCDCTVRTAFRGRARGDSISGTFETHGDGMLAQTGVWSVGRK